MSDFELKPENELKTKVSEKTIEMTNEELDKVFDTGSISALVQKKTLGDILCKAKDASLLAKIIALIIAVGGGASIALCLIFGKITQEQAEALVSSLLIPIVLSILGIFTTVDLNLIAEKFKRK